MNTSVIEYSVIIPAKNEADNLPDLIAEIARAMADRHYEIVVVDDGSRDQTLARLAALQRDGRYPLRSFHHGVSLGQSTALYHAAQLAQGRWLITLDGDGQNDPADIPMLLQRLQQQPELKLIAGHRVRRQDSWIKRFSSRFANGLRARLLRDHTPDTGCGLKIIDREFFLRLPYFDHMHRFIPALVQRHGGQMAIQAVNHRQRSKGVSNYGTLDRALVGIVDLFGVWWLIKRSRLHSKAIAIDVAETESGKGVRQ